MKIDKKYDVYLEQSEGTFKFYATRYGKPWRDLAGDNLILAMYDRMIDLEDEIKHKVR